MRSPASWLLSQQAGLQGRVLRGGAWFIAADLVNRASGLLKMAILARLLAPKDFGVIAMANLVLSWFDYFSQTGFGLALVHRNDDIRPYLNTYWTVQAVRGIALAGFTYTCAPLVAWLLHTPELVLVLRVTSILLLLRGLSNPGVVYLRKELRTEREAAWRSIGALAGLAVAIPLAFLYRNVWALVFSLLATDLTLLALSYSLVKYRPGFEFRREKAREMMRFGKWIFWSNLASYFNLNAATWVIGRYMGSVSVGYYQLAQQFGATPLQQIAGHISAVSFPAFSKLQDRASRRSAFLRSIRFVSICVLPLAAMLSLFSPLVVRVLLGERWMPVAPLLRILTLGSAMSAPAGVMRSFLQAVGRPRLTAQASFLMLFTLAALFYPLERLYGLAGIATAVTLSNVVALCYLYLHSARVLGWGGDLVTVFRHALIASLPVLAAASLMPFCRSLWTVGLIALATLAACGAIMLRQIKTVLRPAKVQQAAGIASS